jgi:ferric-dicitrate binding protein FerR (iron transport regulator)
MTENEKRIKLLILKYGRHEPLTAEENAILKEWRGRSAEHDALPDKFRDEEWVQESLIRLSRTPSAEIWERISEQVKKEKRLVTPWYIKAAGAAAVIALVVIAIRTLGPGGSAVRHEHGLIARIPEFDRTVSTGAGQPGQDSLVLPDGSKVWLSNGSALHYPGVFAGDKRVVRLSGEAFFNIAKDPARRFFVETDKGITQDKSTEFDIRAYPDEPASKVTVLEGAVTVNNGKEEVELNRSLQQVELTKDGMSKPILIKNRDEVTAWRSGASYFAGTDMKTAMRELARRYRKTIVYTDDVQGEAVYLDLPRATGWDETLVQLREFEKKYASFSEKGDTVEVKALGR